MNSDNDALQAANDALGVGAAKVDTAYAAMDSAIDVVNEIKAKLVTANENSTDKEQIQLEITKLQEQLSSIAQGASFSGENWMVAADGADPQTVVDGFIRNDDGTVEVTTASYDVATSRMFADITGGVGSGGILGDVMGITLTTATTSDELADYLDTVETALSSLTDAGAALGALQTRIDLQTSYGDTLSDAIEEGVSRLVDADMEEESAKLSALQTQQQLAIQYLRDFSAEAAPAEVHFDASPDVPLVSDFPMIEAFEPQIDMEAERRQAYEEGHKAAVDSLTAQHAEAIAALQEKNAAELDAQRQQFEGGIADYLAKALPDMSTRVAGELLDAAARLFAPILKTEAERQAVDDLAQRIRSALAREIIEQIKVTGPERLCLLLRDQLQEQGEVLEFNHFEGTDVRVEIGESLLNEIIVVKRHKGDHDSAHGGAWKIAYADFMTTMMAFFLVMWLVNASNEETKASLASYFNPVPLSDDTPSSKGIKKPADQAEGQSTDQKSKVENDRVGGGKAGLDGDSVSASGDDMNYSEAELFKNPYSVLANIAQEVGEQVNVSTKGEGGAADSGPSTGADGGEAYRDPFDPDFWSKQVELPANAKASDTGLPDKEASAFSQPPSDMPSKAEEDAAAKNARTGQKSDSAADVGAEMAAASPSVKDLEKSSPSTAPQEAAKQADSLQKEIQQQMTGVTGKLAEGIVVQPAEGGVLITISDKASTAMFGVGSALPNKELVLAMEKIGKVLSERAGSVIIRGHTDGRPFKGSSGDNWGLSMSRAHAAYYMLVRGGASALRANELEPYKMVRSLQAIQDAVVLGDHSVNDMQRFLMKTLDQRLRTAVPGTFRDTRNVDAALMFAMSGGNPQTLDYLIARDVDGQFDNRLGRVMRRYAQGQATSVLSDLDSLIKEYHSSPIAPYLALVGGNVAAGSEPSRALGYFDQVRLLVPGTNLEEAALRRSLAITLHQLDYARSLDMAGKYVRRFLYSPYASQFVDMFVQVIVDGDGKISRQDWSAVVAMMDDERAHELYLRIARRALLAGNTGLAGVAASLADEAAAGAAQNGKIAGQLYGNLANLFSSTGTDAAASLSQIPDAELSERDRQLRDAARSIAEQVVMPPSVRQAPTDGSASATETGEFTQLLSDSGGEGNATERETDAESLDGKPGGALTGQASARSLSKLMDPTATRSTFRAEGTASSQTAAASQTASAGAEAPALTATPSAAAGPATTTVQQAMTALPAEPTISPDAPGNVGTMTPDGAANQPIGTKTQQVVTPEGALSSLPGGAEETSLLDLVSAAVGAAPKRPNALPAAEAKSDASRANGDGDGSDDGSLDTDGLSSTSALTVLAALSGETVAQQGGVAAADEEAIVGSKADVLTTAVPQAQLGLPTDDTAPDAASAPVCEGEQAPETASFRLQKAGDAAAALSLSIVRGEDGHAEVLDDVSATGKIETVTVLDARRYLGFGMSLNSSALVAAASNDREWAAALQPSSALAGATSVSSTGNVVNTLKLELSPEHLGTVTANMRLVGGRMIVVVDDRQLVKEGYTSLFGREGVPSTGFAPEEFIEWVNSAAEADIAAIEAFVIGQGELIYDLPRAIRGRTQAPVIAVSDQPSLESTLALFDCGVDDVVRKPVHPREILARAAAIRRRLTAISNHTDVGAIRVFSDGRDPEIQGEVFPLPRRERRILEYLIANRGRRVSKAQIFNAIYGVFDEEVEENDAAGNTYLTRSGSFTPDEEGKLVNDEGYTLLGYSYDGGTPTTVVNSYDGLVPVDISGSNLTAVASTAGSLAGNLDSSADDVDPADLPSANSASVNVDMDSTLKTSLTTYDDLGNTVVYDFYYSKTADGEWELSVYNSADAATSGSGSFPYSSSAVLTSSLTFSSKGQLESVDGGTTLSVDINGITIDLSDMTQLAAKSNISNGSVNGSAPSSVESVEIDSTGTVYAVYEDGSTNALYQIAMATVESPDNLDVMSGNVYRTTSTSGVVTLGFAGSSGFGEIVSGALETSNVDLANELTEMIEAQRSYSANSKRTENSALLKQTLGSIADDAGQQTLLAGLESLYAVMGGNEYSLAPSTALASLRDAMQAYAATPGDATLASAAVDAAVDVATSLNTSTNEVQSLRAEADKEIATSVDELNGLLADFEKANDAVKAATAAGTDANNALDTREGLLKQISQIVGITTATRDNNDLSIYTSDGITLFETTARTISFDATTSYSASAVVSPIYIDGVELKAGETSASTAQGSLQALLQLRDEVYPTYQDQLDEIARGVMSLFSETDGSGSVAGLFTTADNTTVAYGDPVIITGLAGLITVDQAAIDDPTKLRDGSISGDTANPDGSSGYSALLSGYVSGFETAMAFDLSAQIGDSATLLDFSTDSVGWVEEYRSGATSASETTSAMLSRATEAYSNSTGVNLDEELILLLDAMQLTVKNSQTEIAKLENESVTGTFDDVGLELGTRTSASLDYDREVQRLQAIISSNSLAEQRMESSQLSMEQMSSSGQTLLDSLVALSGASDATSLEVSADTAMSVLESFVSYANVSVNGEYLFSGINTDVAPLDDTFISDLTAEFNTALSDFMAGEGIGSTEDISSDQMKTFLDDYSSNFDWASWTNASDTEMTSRISTSETVTTSTSLNNDGFKNLVLASIITSQLANADLSAEALTAMNANVTNLAGLSVSGIDAERSSVGLSQERVEKANRAMQSQMEIINTQLTNLIGVDTYEASVRLNTLLTQVETSYTITSKIQGLSLVNFL
eukprot:g25272.t1